MGCNCNQNGNGNCQINSWIDLSVCPPKNPLDLIANTYIDATQGVYLNSSTFLTPPGSWVASGLSVSAAPFCKALETDNFQMAAEADMWTFQRQTRFSSASTAPPVQKMIFLRGGRRWAMHIPISMGGGTYTDLQLTYRDNAATRGDFAGTVPVISFTGSFSGTPKLIVTLNTLGTVSMGLRAIVGGTDYSMLEMEWVIVP